MPRLLANEFVYSSTDERYNNEYLTPTSPLLPHYHHQQQHQHHQLPAATLTVSTSMQENRNSKSLSQSPEQQMTSFTQASTHSSSDVGGQNKDSPPEKQHTQHVHTISSSDGEMGEAATDMHPAVQEAIASIISDDIEDFEGFDEDDYKTPDSSGLFHDHSQEDESNSRCHLKRHSLAEYDYYREDSEGVVEAIEVDDDEDIEEVDGQIMFRARRETTPVKKSNPYADYNPHTPNKRKKRQSDGIFEAISPPNLKTPPDQIVEINSDSTTISQKQKRQQINTKFQLNLNQKQNHKAVNNANKCSTESTSEFPVSSPSNPQQPRGGGKYPPRPPLLKNTLPADSFERQLAMITACNPQMTLAEKIQSWCCEDELSDVEDVNMFDQEFKRLEEQKKSELTKQKNKKGTGSEKPYDFALFQQMIINNMNEAQQNKKLSSSGNSGGCFFTGAAIKVHDESSGSSVSSKSIKHMDERPSTSAGAQQQLQQRRCKPPTNLETGEIKKRFAKDQSKRNQNSTTPPATSSSENERDCFQNSKISGPHKRLPSGQIQIHDKLLCPSSSEEANSQDVPAQIQHQGTVPKNPINNVRHKLPIKRSKPDDNSNSKNVRCLATEEIDSVFRLHRLNREIDKHLTETKHLEDENGTEDAIGVLIEMTKDLGENKQSPECLSIKKHELFKTPTVPPKYFLNNTAAETASPPYNSSTKTTNFSPTITATTTSESQQVANCAIITTLQLSEPPADVKVENGTDIDFDGVYHQQHEFCNYLGLTGMSTATAMANAVAELAQCNLTRRSMRVLRQQQQERREKSAKEERELHSVKSKQKELRKRTRGGCEVPLDVEEEQMRLNDEGTNSQTSEPAPSTTSLKERKNKTSNTSMTTKSSLKSQTSETLVKKEPQIKILCHISATTNKDGAEVEGDEGEKVSKEYVKDLKQHQPRETLMRQAKQQKKELKRSGADIKDDVKKEEVMIISEIKTECLHTDEDELKLEEMPLVLQAQASTSDNRSRILRSPRLIAINSKLKLTQSKTNVQQHYEQFLKMRNEKTSRHDLQSPPSPHYKLEPLGESLTTTPNRYEQTPSPLISKEQITKDLNNTKVKLNSGGDDVLSIDRALTPTSLLIKQKLQAALEESRKTKPSIFIVQSLDSKKENVLFTSESPEKSPQEIKPKTHLEPIKSPSNTPSNVAIRKEMGRKLSELTAKVASLTKKKVARKLRKVKTHKLSSLRSTPKRELRARKIIVIKKNNKTEETYRNKKSEQAKHIKADKCLNKHKLSKSPNSVKPKKIDANFNQGNSTKSYRNVQTETNDLEMYNNQTKTRLMAKASALLQRSRRMSISRGSAKNLRSKLTAKLRNSSLSLAGTKAKLLQPKVCLIRTKIERHVKKEYKTSSTSTTPPPLPKAVANDQRVETEVVVENVKSSSNIQENDNVVVSSTTNSFDPLLIPSPITLRSVHSSAAYVIASATVETKDSWTQNDSAGYTGIRYLNVPPTAAQTMRNPLKEDNGVVHYIYYEVDILIVVQERLISFWKSSQLLNALSVTSSQQKLLNQHQTKLNTISAASATTTLNKPDLLCNSTYPSIGIPQTTLESQINSEWIPLGELKRLTNDQEISAPFANRICLHNSTPIYVEMRARQIPKNHRDCNLLSMYINIYYYHDEDMIAKTNSIQLDTIQSEMNFVNYTTLVDSRYFIMTWPQENLLGKTRSGLCKYSLTPQLDTLASIREFKSMRHTIRYLECMSDDKLIGFGDSQITIWDHRSGDVLMNYDLDIPLGRNLGSVYYPSQEIEQNNMITLFQYRDPPISEDQPPELLTIACTIAHSQPSYRILQQLPLPPAFKVIKRAINTGEHLVITADNDEEIWICCNNPALVALVPQQQSPQQLNKCRFFNRERSQLIELTEEALNFDTLANHLLQLAAGLALN